MRCSVAAAIALVSAVGPAFAQSDEVPFEPGVIEACLADREAATCIGSGAEACTSEDFGGSNVGYGLCFGAELRWWDAELNRVYGALMELYAVRDAELVDLGSKAPPSGPALRASQRAWISWRDSYCAFEATTWGGGSGAGIAQTECEMTLTAEQALRLDARLAAEGG